MLLRVFLHQRCYTIIVPFPVTQGVKSSKDQDSGNDSTTVLPSNPKSSVYTAIVPSVEPKNIAGLILPASLQGVTQHHVDFIRCDDIDTANAAKE